MTVDVGLDIAEFNNSSLEDRIDYLSKYKIISFNNEVVFIDKELNRVFIGPYSYGFNNVFINTNGILVINYSNTVFNGLFNVKANIYLKKEIDNNKKNQVRILETFCSDCNEYTEVEFELNKDCILTQQQNTVFTKAKEEATGYIAHSTCKLCGQRVTFKLIEIVKKED